MALNSIRTLQVYFRPQKHSRCFVPTY